MVPAPLQIQSLDQTYKPELLSLIDSIDHVELGRLKDPYDNRDYSSEKILEGEPPSQPLAPEPASKDNLLVSLNLPSKIKKNVDLRGRTGPILDQFYTSQCVTHSGSSLRIFDERIERKRTLVPQPGWWYNRCKENDGIPNEDGTFISTAAKIARKQGVILEDPRSRKDDPAGRFYRIDSYYRLKTIEEIVTALSQKHPVWFGIEVGKEIFTPVKTDKGYVVKQPSGKGVGGHAMLLVGYDLEYGWFLDQNSWGASWGDGGFAWLPMTHFVTYSDWDAWVVVDHRGPAPLV